MIEKNQIRIFDRWRLSKVHISESIIKAFWNTTMFIHVHVVCGCFCITMTEFSSCNKLYGSQILKYLLSGIKMLATSCSNFLPLRVWSQDQQHRCQLEVCQKCRTSILRPNLLNPQAIQAPMEVKTFWPTVSESHWPASERPGPPPRSATSFATATTPDVSPTSDLIALYLFLLLLHSNDFNVIQLDNWSHVTLWYLQYFSSYHYLKSNAFMPYISHLGNRILDCRKTPPPHFLLFKLVHSVLYTWCFKNTHCLLLITLEYASWEKTSSEGSVN